MSVTFPTVVYRADIGAGRPDNEILTFLPLSPLEIPRACRWGPREPLGLSQDSTGTGGTQENNSC